MATAHKHDASSTPRKERPERFLRQGRSGGDTPRGASGTRQGRSRSRSRHGLGGRDTRSPLLGDREHRGSPFSSKRGSSFSSKRDQMSSGCHEELEDAAKAEADKIKTAEDEQIKESEVLKGAAKAREEAVAYQNAKEQSEQGDAVIPGLDKLKVKKLRLAVKILEGTNSKALTAAIARAEAGLDATKSVLENFAHVSAVLLAANIKKGTWLEISVGSPGEEIIAVLRRGNKIVVKNAHGEVVDILHSKSPSPALNHRPQQVGRTFSDADVAGARQLLVQEANRMAQVPSGLEGNTRVTAVSRGGEARVLERQTAMMVSFHHRRAAEMIRDPEFDLDRLGVAVSHFIQAGPDKESLFPMFKAVVERWYVESALQQDRLRMCKLDIEGRRIGLQGLQALPSLPEDLLYAGQRLQLCCDEIEYALSGFNYPVPSDLVQLANYVCRLLDCAVRLTSQAPPANTVRNRLADLITAFGNAASATFGQGSPDMQLLVGTVASLRARISA